MHLLLTRPNADAERTAAQLRSRGHRVEIDPLLTIRSRPRPLDLEGMQAILFTSANGLRAFLASSEVRDIPAFAVGPASAAEARSSGFRSVLAAKGDAAALADLVIARLDPNAGPLLHPAGSVIAGGLSEKLVAAGFELRRVVLYEAVPATRLAERTQQLLHARAFDGALFYSPRTATTFVSLVQQAGLRESCAVMTAYCLSPAVAAALSPVAWRRLCTASEPREAALLGTMAADEDRETGSE